MKKIILFLIIPFTVFSQKITENFASNSLGITREITIALPASYERNPTKKYPVLLVLDGEFLFDAFTGALNYGSYWDDFPEVIVIGINQNKNNERITDCGYDSTDGLPSKQATAFFDFISADLLPSIEKKYRTIPFRMIAGYDTTAGFLNFFLYKDNPLFNAYISLSPDLAPEMEKRIPTRLSELKKPIFYYQSIADGDTNKIKEVTKTLDDNIKLISNESVFYKYDVFENTTHYSFVLQAIPKALYHIFESYKPISLTEFSEKIVVLPNKHTDYLINKYSIISDKLALKIPVRLNDFKAIEAAILKNKNYEELDKLSEIASANYPKSMLSYYELGLMYEKMDNPKKAALKYQQASQKEAIGNLTKNMMFDKYDEMKSLISKK
ncbi:alpha/beta hydrolase [Flavobacterium sp.]|uniref:alpha/beta hydrolase n=1 Tax=Flavobacterium sp. TaxID=239 RepID=UPI003C52CAAF